MRQQLVSIKTISSQYARKEVFDDYIGIGDEFLHERPVVGRSEVGGERQLVPIRAQEVRRLAVGGERRPPTPGVVARSGSLDLDDVRAQITQHHATVRSGEYPGEVEDFNAF
jgi:hypothetical protein